MDLQKTSLLMTDIRRAFIKGIMGIASPAAGTLYGSEVSRWSRLP